MNKEEARKQCVESYESDMRAICPLINDKCNDHCVCYCSPDVKEVGKKQFPEYEVVYGGCRNAMFDSERDCNVSM